MKRIIFILAMSLTVTYAWAWGQKGHDTTAAIAERHLTPATKAAVDSLLSGQSLVYWANWLDNASHTKPYAYTKTWHYKNVDADQRYEEAPANPAGDVVTAIRQQVEILKGVQHGDKTLALKILTHIVGDLHMPLHMGHGNDLGGNRIMVKYFGAQRNLHSVWDSALPESAHKWSYTEWADQLDRLSPEEQEAIVSGSVHDWAKEGIGLADIVYKSTPAGTSMSYDEVATAAPIIEQQFLYGGLRLAHLLNDIFDPEYGK